MNANKIPQRILKIVGTLSVLVIFYFSFDSMQPRDDLYSVVLLHERGHSKALRVATLSLVSRQNDLKSESKRKFTNRQLVETRFYNNRKISQDNLRALLYETVLHPKNVYSVKSQMSKRNNFQTSDSSTNFMPRLRQANRPSDGPLNSAFREALNLKISLYTRLDMLGHDNIN
jgi:hypothetical protein